MKYLMHILCCLFVCFGCSQVTEVSRTVWGTSTRALNDARIDASVASYECVYDDCFNAVLDLTKARVVNDQLNDKIFELFQKNYVKGFIVVLGIEGNVDTTEVGIFFSRIKQNVTKIEVSSLSVTAKEKVADAIGAHLEQFFPKVN